MGTIIDIFLVLFIGLGMLAGIKKGLIKSLVSLLGLVAITIISFRIRLGLTDFLIDKMPFSNFGGELYGLTALNILIYNALAFVVIFVVLYCVLNIIVKVTGFIDTLLKFTVIWIIPSKIGGALIGFLEAWVYLYLVIFVLIQFSLTNTFVTQSTMANTILNNTPIVGTYLSGAKAAAIGIYDSIREYTKDESKTIDDLNVRILQYEINYGLIGKAKANELIETGKIDLEGVKIA